MAKKTRKESTVLMSTRVSKGHFSKVEKILEDQNISISEYLRKCSESELDSKSIEYQLLRFEQSIVDKIFEMVSIISGITDSEKLQAKKKYNDVIYNSGDKK